MVKLLIATAVILSVCSVMVVLWLVLPNRPTSAHYNATIQNLRTAVNVINQHLSQENGLPHNLSCDFLPPDYKLVFVGKREYIVIAPDVFYRNRIAFNYACDSKTNIIRFYAGTLRRGPTP